MYAFHGKVFYSNVDHNELPEYYCEAANEQEAEKIFIAWSSKMYSKKYFEFCEVFEIDSI